METDFNGALKWVENTIQIYNELLDDKKTTTIKARRNIL